MNDSDIIACDRLGTFLELNHPVAEDACCRLSDQNSTACRRIFAPTNGLLDSACIGRPETCRLFDRCRLPETLYTSAEQNNEKGNGSLLLARYQACANIPNISRLLSQGVLIPSIDRVAREHLRLGPQAGDHDFEYKMQQVTASVTDCLASTCRTARANQECYDTACSSVRLISNSTLPNLVGINGCLNNICNVGTDALPWADADIVGVGVFSSYVMQCALVIMLWAGLAAFSWHYIRRGRPDRPSRESNVGSHFASWIDLVLQCHKAQCYFGGTLMIAVIASNIFKVDLVITFMVTPLATNSMLPVIFSYFLLVYYRVSSAAITLLTAVVYLLSSVVYWILYFHLPLPSGITRGEMYKRYRLSMSSIAACGQFSGLSVCPIVDSDSNEFMNGITARTYLRVLTPLIWTWATFVFLALLVYQAYAHLHSYRSSGSNDRPAKAGLLYSRIPIHRSNVPGFQPSTEQPPPRWQRIAFWFTTLVFLAAVGMQISVLSTAIKLDMVNGNGWSFGQVVAVTIWIPPLLEYACGEINDLLSKSARQRSTEPPPQDLAEREKESNRGSTSVTP